jgi:hypothetical protein
MLRFLFLACLLFPALSVAQTHSQKPKEIVIDEAGLIESSGQGPGVEPIDARTTTRFNSLIQDLRPNFDREVVRSVKEL